MIEGLLHVDTDFKKLHDWQIPNVTPMHSTIVREIHTPIVAEHEMI